MPKLNPRLWIVDSVFGGCYMREWAIWKLKRIKQGICDTFSDLITAIRVFIEFYGQGIMVGIIYLVFALVGALIIWDFGSRF